MDLNTLNQQLANDPQWQQLVKQFPASKQATGGGAWNSMLGNRQPLNDYLHSKYGINPEDTYAFDPTTGLASDTPQDDTLKQLLYVAALPAAGYLGAAVIPGLLGGGGAAGAGAAGADAAAGGAAEAAGTAGGAAAGGAGAATGGELASTSLGSLAGFSPALPTATTSGALATAGSAGIGDTISNFLKNKGAISDASKLVSDYAQSQASNRFKQGEQQQGYDKLMLEAQQDRNLNESDALTKLMTTKYLQGGGSKFKPPTLSINGRSYQTPDLGYGPTPASADQIAGANSLAPQLLNRLQPGGSYTPMPASNYTQPGTGEDIANWLGLAGGVYGAATGGGQPKPAQGGSSSGFGINDIMNWLSSQKQSNPSSPTGNNGF